MLCHPARVSTAGSRGPGPGASAPALVQVLVLGVALGVVEVSLFLADPVSPFLVVVLTPAAAAVFLGAGALASLRRPANRTGPLLCAGGTLLLLAGLSDVDSPPLVAVGLVTATTVVAVVLHALLAFPSGRLRDRASRLVVAGGYLVTTVLQAPLYLLGNPVAAANPLQVADRPDLLAVARTVNSAGAAVVIAAAGVLLARRWRAATLLQRRTLGPVSLYGVTALVAVTFAAQLERLVGLDPLLRFTVQIVLVAGVPVAFTVGILRGGFARTEELAELAGWLGSADRGRGELRAALARTLGDPTVTLSFRADDDGDGTADSDGGADDDGDRAPAVALIDAAGRPVHPGRDRGGAAVRLGGRTVGVVGFDASLVDPATARAAGRVVAIAVDRERLTALLLAEREQLRDSRARLVRAGDRERRRLAQDLHDRLQGRLVLLAIRAGTLGPGSGAEDVAALRRDVDDVAAELRLVVAGVMPALLIERGLAAAVEDILSRVPLRTGLEVHDDDAARLPPSVEGTAYHVVAEAVTNAVKHAAARELRVVVRREAGVLHLEVRDDGVGGARPAAGSGLRGLTDRVDALGGRLRVQGVVAGGTRVLVELPCGS